MHLFTREVKLDPRTYVNARCEFIKYRCYGKRRKNVLKSEVLTGPGLEAGGPHGSGSAHRDALLAPHCLRENTASDVPRSHGASSTHDHEPLGVRASSTGPDWTQGARNNRSHDERKRSFTARISAPCIHCLSFVKNINNINNLDSYRAQTCCASRAAPTVTDRSTVRAPHTPLRGRSSSTSLCKCHDSRASRPPQRVSTPRCAPRGHAGPLPQCPRPPHSAPFSANREPHAPLSEVLNQTQPLNTDKCSGSGGRRGRGVRELQGVTGPCPVQI